MAWNEDSLHRWLARLPRPLVLSGTRGHDSAVLRRLRGEPVLCVDTCIEGVHYESGTAPRRVGEKAALRALSDLAPSAAVPRALLLSVRAPSGTAERWLRAAIQGVRAAGARHGAELVGGDLAQAPGPTQLCVTALGERTLRGLAPGRDRLRADDLLYVTGPLGGSLGLNRRGRHLDIRPRIAEGLAAARAGARALMDISDGLCIDLHRMARLSGTRIELELAQVPIHPDARRMGGDALRHALHDGEDHELLIGAPARLQGRLERALPGLVWIGRARCGRGLVLLGPGGQRQVYQLRQGGWLHGA